MATCIRILVWTNHTIEVRRYAVMHGLTLEKAANELLARGIAVVRAEEEGN